ncbi:hypothetical protein NX821_001494 [Clostridium septicum]|uniref:hypothetical protein n=1 Tax=Clostridium septicum TaxID=1504 RepID=UPI003217A224
MKNILEIEDDIYTYKGNKYSRSNERDLLKDIGKNLEIIIIDEALLIKKFEVNTSERDFEEFINETIEKEFLVNENMLFHYEYVKSENIVYIYSIKQGNLVRKLGTKVNKLKVHPMQFIIKDFINKKIKKFRSFISITEFRGKYYVLNIHNNIIVKCYISNKINNLNEVIESGVNNDNLIILDKNIKIEKIDSYIKEKYVKYLNIGDIINEKLCRKQKLYTKKLF